MSKLLVVIDVQNGFINEHSEWLVPKLCEYIKDSDYTKVVATRYLNDKDTPCYKYLNWEGCMTPEEYALVPEVRELVYRVFDKYTYTSVTDSLFAYMGAVDFDEIHLCGIDAGCCVIATAYDLFDKGFNVKVIPDLCAVVGDFPNYLEAVRYQLRQNVPCLEIAK